MNRADLISKKGSMKQNDFIGRMGNRSRRDLRGRVLTDDESHQLLSAITDEREKALIAVILGTGIGNFDLIEVRLADIDRFWRLTFRRQKTGEARGVQLSSRVMEILGAYLEQRKDKSPYLFPAKKPGVVGRDWWKHAENVAEDTPMDSKIMLFTIDRAIQRSGMDIKRCDLRLTFRTRAAEKREEDEMIEKLVCLLHVNVDTAKEILYKYVGKRKNVGL